MMDAMMKLTPRIAALGVLLGLVGGAARAQTGNAYYQVENDTASGGDTVFSVNSDVVFQNLTLTEMFADGSRFRVPLFDPTGRQTTSVDTGLVFLTSSSFLNPNPTHGAVTLATLSGIFDNGLGQYPSGHSQYMPGDTESFDIENTFAGPTTSATVYADFTASLINPMSGSQFNIFAQDANSPGQSYAAGVFSLQGVPAAVPEPSPLALLGGGALSLAALGLMSARRRAARSPFSVTAEGESSCA